MIHTGEDVVPDVSARCKSLQSWLGRGPGKRRTKQNFPRYLSAPGYNSGNHDSLALFIRPYLILLPLRGLILTQAIKNKYFRRSINCYHPGEPYVEGGWEERVYSFLGFTVVRGGKRKQERGDNYAEIKSAFLLLRGLLICGN